MVAEILQPQNNVVANHIFLQPRKQITWCQPESAGIGQAVRGGKKGGKVLRRSFSKIRFLLFSGVWSALTKLFSVGGSFVNKF